MPFEPFQLCFGFLIANVVYFASAIPAMNFCWLCFVWFVFLFCFWTGNIDNVLVVLVIFVANVVLFAAAAVFVLNLLIPEVISYTLYLLVAGFANAIVVHLLLRLLIILSI